MTCGANTNYEWVRNEQARPTPFPQSYADLVFTDDGWSQTIIVDGKRPEWLLDDDIVVEILWPNEKGFVWNDGLGTAFAIRVRRREPKRETVKGWLCHVPAHIGATPVTYDLIDGQPDLSTLKITEAKA